MNLQNIVLCLLNVYTYAKENHGDVNITRMHKGVEFTYNFKVNYDVAGNELIVSSGSTGQNRAEIID